MNNKTAALTETDMKEIAQALFEHAPWFYDTIEDAELDIEGCNIFKLDHYVTDGPGYAGVLYVIVWGIPKASVLIRTPEGRLEVQAD